MWSDEKDVCKAPEVIEDGTDTRAQGGSRMWHLRYKSACVESRGCPWMTGEGVQTSVRA